MKWRDTLKDAGRLGAARALLVLLGAIIEAVTGLVAATPVAAQEAVKLFV